MLAHYIFRLQFFFLYLFLDLTLDSSSCSMLALRLA